VVWLLELIGPTGVIVVGALILICVAIWLVARVKTPPVMVQLKRT
jgi:hypothetical protein